VTLTGIFLSGCSTAEKRQATVHVRGSWLMYQYRPDHNAVIPARSTSSWTYDTKSKINGGLAIVDDVLFVDTFDFRILALDALSGAVRWQSKTDNIVMSTPIVADGKVFVGTGHNGGLHSGASSFAYATRGGAQDPPMWGREEGDHMLAFDAGSGVKAWSYRTAGEDMPSPVYVDGTIVFANGDFHAYGLDARNGSARWQRELRGISTMASAAATGRTAFVGLCTRQLRGETVALDARTGTVKWSAPFGDCDSSPTVANNRVFVTGVDENVMNFGYGGHGYAAALDAQTGRLRWKYRSVAGPFTRPGSNERAIAGVYANGAYITSLATSGEVVALDARSGRPIWSRRTAGPVKMSPVVAGGRVYFGDTVGVFYVLGERDGRLISTRMFEQGFATAPCVVFGKTIYLVNATQVIAMPLAELERTNGEPDKRDGMTM